MHQRAYAYLDTLVDSKPLKKNLCGLCKDKKTKIKIKNIKLCSHCLKCFNLHWSDEDFAVRI